jgi:Tol biopolymer transport system component/DNA-binding winged helix-turn-helix (wHTH) protein
MDNSFNHLYKFDAFVVDASGRRLTRHGELVALTSRAFDLLLVLIQNSGRLMGKNELMDAVWQDTAVEEANLAVNISTLRKALGEAPSQSRYIVTIPGRGYKFLADVTQGAYEPVEITLHERIRATLIDEEFEAAETSTVGPQAQAFVATNASSRPFLNRLIIAAGVLLVTGTMVWLVSFRGNRKERLSLPPMKIAPFTSMQGGEFEPAFSPDGRQIAFVRGGEDPLTGSNGIYLKLLNSETPLKITSKPGDYASPVWSPDGGFVAFTRHFDGDKGIYIVPALGGAERKLISCTWEGELNAQIDWSPDGRFIAFTERLKDEAQEPYCVYLLSVETLEKKQITFPSGLRVSDRFPMFSPDGKSLAFARLSAEGTGIFLAPSTGGDAKGLLFEQKTIMGLAWTAEGELIFSSNRDGRRSLWRVSANGGEPERQSFGTEEASFPSISRQGNLLAYEQANEDSNIWRLELDKADGKNKKAKRILSSTRREAGVDISPDSKRIAYESDRSGNSEIWVCNSDGTDNLQLTNFAGAKTRSPRWSPDGKQIAFQGNAAGQADIFIIDANGGQPRRLTEDVANDCVPTWSRDGRTIYFSSQRDGSDQLWKIPVDGGTAIKLTNSEAGNAHESADSRNLYHSARFNSGLWKLPIEGGAGIRLLEFPERAYWGYWALVEKGIYYVRSDGKDQFMIEFFDFATRKVKPVAPLEKMPTPWEKGLAVSGDGRWLLYSQLDQNNSDIMVVGNFR